MQIGIVGLGKMGRAIAARLMHGGHEVLGFDIDTDAVEEAARSGVLATRTIELLIEQLRAPRTVWAMLPAGHATDEAIGTLAHLLAAGDTVIDGGNSNYHDAAGHATALAAHGIGFLDVGTSGGIRGELDGFCLMIGGSTESVARGTPIFETLAPAPSRGWAHVGPHGAGHFVKMIHNGIEYGAMQALAEGLAILDAKEEFDLDLAKITEVWRSGSVIRSWLLDLTAELLADDATLADIAPRVADSGEGRWTVQEAIDLGVAAPVITLALLARLKSRDATGFSERLLAAMRNRFGGHAVTRDTPDSD